MSDEKNYAHYADILMLHIAWQVEQWIQFLLFGAKYENQRQKICPKACAFPSMWEWLLEEPLQIISNAVSVCIGKRTCCDSQMADGS